MAVPPRQILQQQQHGDQLTKLGSLASLASVASVFGEGGGGGGGIFGENLEEAVERRRFEKTAASVVRSMRGGRRGTRVGGTGRAEGGSGADGDSRIHELGGRRVIGWERGRHELLRHDGECADGCGARRQLRRVQELQNRLERAVRHERLTKLGGTREGAEHCGGGGLGGGARCEYV